MACLKLFGLANCNGVDKPITSSITAKDQPADVNTSDQELYRGMVGSLLYLALRHLGLVQILSFPFPNFHASFLIRGNCILKQPNGYFVISRRQSALALHTKLQYPILLCRKFQLILCGAMLTLIGLVARTLVDPPLVSCSC
jgi:hypothetical protein